MFTVNTGSKLRITVRLRWPTTYLLHLNGKEIGELVFLTHFMLECLLFWK